ncbi:hypothetical protein [Leekyejoonella antrihumi]|uniref:Uncharacterized protein n=1 Tax=Leekyejoonella antrihumi TaxID=1660198 RepID=A0A563DVZ5_9MICO|nr:hypothetical protein [Leekyejoonella antrihumi]TWP33894.1 hypothetical protein FGL98_19495 [Leekyejoonella antrihumi]
MKEVERWFEDHVPAEWLTGSPVVTVDREEILVLCPLPAGADSTSEAAAEATIDSFRSDTRRDRMAIADDAQDLFRRKVSWGASCGETTTLFTMMSVPVMTRLRQRERRTLETLVASGVARSRSDALGWCVRLVAEHESDWVQRLRDALTAVDEVRADGPDGSR